MKLDKLRVVLVSALLCMPTASLLLAQDTALHTIPNSKYGFVSTAADLGPEQSSKQVTVYVWLQMRNVESLQELVEQQYDSSSGNYRNWLTPEQFDSTYAPTADNIATVKSYLVAHNLAVSAVGPRNLYVKATGSIADAQSAFGVEIHRFNVHGRTYRANTTDPKMSGPAGALVSRVGGLSDYAMKPHSVRPVSPDTGKPFAAVPMSSAPNGAFFSPNCLQGIKTENFSTDGSEPKATYLGNAYGSPITNSTPGTVAPCGYQPSDLQTAYGFNALYKAGLNGANQTIVIVDAWGSPTIATDASAFAGFYGLAPLNLTIYPFGTTCAASPDTTLDLCQGWAVETSLDVEAAHSVAPGANIALIEAASPNDDDLVAGILYAIDNKLGNVISNSYGESEAQEGLPSFDPFDGVLILAAAEGISVDFSSGDDGDEVLAEGYLDVNYPASSPYATAVGGTSLFLNKNGTMAFQTGWGNNFTQIAAPPDAKGYSAPLVPPDTSTADGNGFNYGAGGGKSGVFRKPSFQQSLPGRWRLLPDISYLADPDTGIEIFCTGSSCFNSDPADIYIGLIGGTSLACPMFSSVWSIATEKAGHPLGQPARSLYNLPYGAITDVVPVSSPFNAAGIITEPRHTILETPYQLIMPGTFSPFLSGLFQGSNTGAWYAISFGTDSSLFTDYGWDDVTGLGTPNGLEFVNAVARRP